MNRIERLLILLVIIVCLHYSCTKTEEPVDMEIVINELMPVNSTVISDQNGEFDDWIELYNVTSSQIDISGYYLSDNSSNRTKWRLPDGTTISGKGYLIIWADKDTTQVGLHANFKLSSLGEEVIISDRDGYILDGVVYPGQTMELSYSRNPDGTGKFIWQNPTFNKSNN